MFNCSCLVEILIFWYLLEIMKMKFDQDLCKKLWYELNPRVRCAFGNVFFLQICILNWDPQFYVVFNFCISPEVPYAIWLDIDSWKKGKLKDLFANSFCIGEHIRWWRRRFGMMIKRHKHLKSMNTNQTNKQN